MQNITNAWLLTPEEYLLYKAWLDSQPVPQSLSVIWQDKIQEGVPLWGFDQFGVQSGGVTVVPGDINGANLSRVLNPAGTGFCLRSYGDLRASGSYIRSQAGVYGFNHSELNAAADVGVFMEKEVFIPKAFSADNNPYSWLSLQDIHVTDDPSLGGDRMRSYLGLLVKQDGSMRASLGWGGKLYVVNRDFGTPPPTSTVSLPVGKWFKIRTYFKRSTEPTTVKVWFDDVLALEWVGAINSLPTNTITEAYLVKLYGGVQVDKNGKFSPWGEVECFTRNVRIWR